MISVNVTVRLQSGPQFSYSALVPHSVDAAMDALDLFGICKVRVTAI